VNLRLLLRAYPRAYRAEILTTMLDAGSDRPGFGDALHLVACGLRQRFRLPRRPRPVFAALLAAVMLGAFGAVTGTWLGWQTAASAPTPAAAGALTSAAAGLPHPSIETWRTAMGGPGVDSTISGQGAYDPSRIRTALTADGWHITRFATTTGRVVVGPLTNPWTTTPVHESQFKATRAGLTLTGDSVRADAAHADLNGLSLNITADPDAAIRPVTIAGLVVGALLGWLVTAALTYRRPPRRWPASVLTAVALAAAVLPAVVAYGRTYKVMVYDTHAPNQYVADIPTDHISPVLTVAALLLTVLAVVGASVAFRRSVPRPELA
jgi:hypothetical protein